MPGCQSHKSTDNGRKNCHWEYRSNCTDLPSSWTNPSSCIMHETHLYTRPSVCLSARPFVRVSVRLSVFPGQSRRLPMNPANHASINSSVCPCVRVSSVRVSVSPPIHWSVCRIIPFINPSVHQSFRMLVQSPLFNCRLFNCPSVRTSANPCCLAFICLSVHPSIHPSIHAPSNLPVHPSICPSISPSANLSVHSSTRPPARKITPQSVIASNHPLVNLSVRPPVQPSALLQLASPHPA